MRFLIDEKLRPLGLITLPDGSAPQVEKADPLLALNMRKGVVPQWMVGALSALFSPLFWPPLLLVVLAAFVAFDVWLFGVHGVGQSIRATLEQPLLILAALGLTVLGAAFHECGHAAGCRYGGARPGQMGFGLYLVWPVFFTDVTDSYRLSKWGRLRTDLGGVYFNAIVILALAAAYFATGQEWLLAVILVQHFEILHQLLPFVRLDGYYVVSDFTGVPDLFARMRPILRSMIPWRRTEDSVLELKRWARITATVWVLLVIPFILFNVGIIVLSFPRILATAWRSLLEIVPQIREAAGWVDVAVGIVQIAALALPVVGMAAMMWKLGRRVATWAWRSTDERPILRTLSTAAGLAVVAIVAYVWLPNGDYEPIQEGERWTYAEATAVYADVASGRPGLVFEEVAAERGELGPDEDATETDPSPSASPTEVTSTAPTITTTSEPVVVTSPDESTEDTDDSDDTDDTDATVAPSETATTSSPTPTPTATLTPTPTATSS